MHTMSCECISVYTHFLYVYVCVYVYIYIYIARSICVYMYIIVYICTCIHVFLHTRDPESHLGAGSKSCPRVTPSGGPPGPPRAGALEAGHRAAIC